MMRFYAAIILAGLMALHSLAADSGGATPINAESIGNRLLDDLPSDTPPPQTPAQSQQKPKTTKQIEDSLKASTLLHDFNAGANPAAQPLLEVQRGMQRAQTLLT